MTFLMLIAAFLAGLGLGYAVRPQVERRRRIRLAIAQLRARQGSAVSGRPAQPEAGMPELHMPRDYYAAGARERGSLAEGFGLRGSAGRKPETAPEAEPAAAAMPRDYYERETPDDEGILSEGYGLKRRPTTGDGA